MTAILKQSTASQTRILGPFVDDTDGKTPETGLTIANTDIKLSANGGASANKNSGGGTHIVNGCYAITLDATDTATVGELHVSCVMSGALPVVARFQVVEEAVYDKLFATSASLNDLSAAQVNAECDTAISDASLATAAALATVDGNVDLILADTGTDGVVVSAASISSIQSGLATSAALATVDTNVDAILVDTGTTLPATLSTIAGYIDTEVASILSAVGALNDLDSTEVQTAAAAALTAYDPPTKAELDTAVSPLATAAALTTVDTVVDAIKAKTDNLIEVDTAYDWTTANGTVSTTIAT